MWKRSKQVTKCVGGEIWVPTAPEIAISRNPLYFDHRKLLYHIDAALFLRTYMRIRKLHGGRKRTLRHLYLLVPNRRKIFPYICVVLGISQLPTKFPQKNFYNVNWFFPPIRKNNISPLNNYITHIFLLYFYSSSQNRRIYL